MKRRPHQIFQIDTLRKMNAKFLWITSLAAVSFASTQLFWLQQARAYRFNTATTPQNRLRTHQFNDQIAQASEGMKQQCENALQEAIDTIEDGRSVQVVKMNPIDLTVAYEDYPQDAPFGVSLGMEGQAAADVLNSNQFMTSVSTGIIEQCGPVSLVDFQMHRTDWAEVYGAVNGRVVSFTCVEPGIGATVEWGERYCL